MQEQNTERTIWTLHLTGFGSTADVPQHFDTEREARVEAARVLRARRMFGHPVSKLDREDWEIVSSDGSGRLWIDTAADRIQRALEEIEAAGLDCGDEIGEAAGRVAFCATWANAEEAMGRHFGGGTRIEDHAPETPLEWIEWGTRAVADTVAAVGESDTEAAGEVLDAWGEIDTDSLGTAIGFSVGGWTAGLDEIDAPGEEYCPTSEPCIEVEVDPPEWAAEILGEDGRLPGHAWPGGYPIVYVAADGGTFCPGCANGDNGSEARLDYTSGDDTGWHVEAFSLHMEGPPEECSHCGAEIESAYGDPEPADGSDNPPTGARVRLDGGGVDGGQTGTVAARDSVKVDGRGILELPGEYRALPVDWVLVDLDGGRTVSYPAAGCTVLDVAALGTGTRVEVVLPGETESRTGWVLGAGDGWEARVDVAEIGARAVAWERLRRVDLRARGTWRHSGTVGEVARIIEERLGAALPAPSEVTCTRGEDGTGPVEVRAAMLPPGGSGHGRTRDSVRVVVSEIEEERPAAVLPCDWAGVRMTVSGPAPSPLWSLVVGALPGYYEPA